MIVHPDFRRNVVYLVAGASVREPYGSAFFVSVSILPDLFDGYVVTASHVLDACDAVGGKLCVRLNAESGREDIETRHEDWYRSDDTDISILPVDEVEGSNTSYLRSETTPNPTTGATAIVQGHIPALPASFFWTADQAVAHAGITPQTPTEGDDVFIPSLFTPFAGDPLNQPVVRFGRISLITNDKVRLEKPKKADGSPMMVDATLIESRSWSGESGAPVYVSFTPYRTGISRIDTAPVPWRLLGLPHGHWRIRQPLEQGEDTIATVRTPTPSGIGVVIPARKILDMLNIKAFVERREAMLEAWERKRSPTPGTDL